MTRSIDPAIASATAAAAVAVPARIDAGLPLGLLLCGVSLVVSLFGDGLVAGLAPQGQQANALLLVQPLAILLALPGVWCSRCLFWGINVTLTGLTAAAALLVAAAVLLVVDPFAQAIPGMWDGWRIATAASLAGAAMVSLVVAYVVRPETIPEAKAAVAAVERSVQHASDRLKAVSDRLQAVVPTTQPGT